MLLRHSTENLIRTRGGLYLNPRLISHCLDTEDGGYGRIASPASIDTSFRHDPMTLVGIVYIRDFPNPITWPDQEYYVMASRSGGQPGDGVTKLSFGGSGGNPRVTAFFDEGAAGPGTPSFDIISLLGWVGVVMSYHHNDSLPTGIAGMIGQAGVHPIRPWISQAGDNYLLNDNDHHFDIGDRGNSTSENPHGATGFVGIWNSRWTDDEMREFIKNLKVPEGETQLMLYPGVGPDGAVENWGSHVPASRQLQRMTYINHNGLPHPTYIEMPLLPVELDQLKAATNIGPTYLTSSPASLMDSGAHDFLRDELDDDFVTGSDQQIFAYDDKWTNNRTPSGTGDFDVIASSGRLVFDAPAGGDARNVRWEGARGDEIEVDIHRGDQTGDVNVAVYVRDQGSAAGSEDNYRIKFDASSVIVHRFNGGSATVLGSTITHTFAKDTTQRWRVFARTMADRVRIYLYVDGTLVGTRDDISASRWVVAVFCGVGADQATANTSGVKTYFDNLVIRSTPLVYDDEFDYVTSDSDLDAEDAWLRWRGTAGVHFFQLNAANDRLEFITTTASVTAAYYWTAPSGQHPVGVELDLFTGGTGGSFSESGINIRHDGGSVSNAEFYELLIARGGAAKIYHRDFGGGEDGVLLDLTTASPAFSGAADTLYHIVFWAETIDASTVRLHLVIDDKYWTFDHTTAQRITLDGRVGMFAATNFATQGMYFDNIRIYDSPPKLLVGPAKQEWVRHADSFTVGSDIQLDAYDPLWVDSRPPIGTAPQFDVIAASDEVVWDAPNGSEVKTIRWEGGLGNEIEMDIHIGDQAGEVLPIFVIQDQGSAASSADIYRIKSFETFWRLTRYVGGAGTVVSGGDFVIAITKDTSYHIKLTTETLVDRVLISFTFDGQTFVWADTTATRHTVIGFCGFGHEQENANTSGVKTSFDNLVIRQRSRSDVDDDYTRATADTAINTVLVKTVRYRVRRDVYRSVVYPVVTTKLVEAPPVERVKFALEKPGFTPNQISVLLRIRPKTQ